jgi:hypothetical protein
MRDASAPLCRALGVAFAIVVFASARAAAAATVAVEPSHGPYDLRRA